MSDTKQRLARCFMSVFPTLRNQEVSLASQESVAAWDSVATVTLLCVIEEEFGVSIDFEELENLTSFQRIHEYLCSRQPA
jgi:acyl carrier protein